MEMCPKCCGEGIFPPLDQGGDIFLDEECPTCEGSGWVDDVDDEEE